MERRMKMNEVEKAAKEYASCDITEGGLTGLCGMDASKYEPFIAGAQWQAKQSPWISVEERLPEKDGLRVWVKSGCFNNQPLVYHKGKFYARLSDGAYDGSVTHWMPIPE